MADFDQAVNFVLANEGGYVDSPNDSGGATNFGISLRFLRELPEDRLKRYGYFGGVNANDIREMSLVQAKIIYRGEFWDKAPFDRFYSQDICNYVFDMCVHHGISQGIKILQRAIWAVAKNMDGLCDDGILGEKTFNSMGVAMLGLRFALPAERAGFMRLIAEKNTKDGEYLNGWLHRCYRI